MASDQEREEVDRFILGFIDSIPHLEAVLLLWREPRQLWTSESVARRLWIRGEHAKTVLQDLVREGFVAAEGEPEQYRYRPDACHDDLIERTARLYREEMIRLTSIIHGKPSSAIRAFAQAFRLKKEPE